MMKLSLESKAGIFLGFLGLLTSIGSAIREQIVQEKNQEILNQIKEYSNSISTDEENS